MTYQLTDLGNHKAGIPAPARRQTVRAGLAAMLVSLLASLWLTGSPAAVAAPSDLANLPASLQMYVPGSPEWASSPWMTSPACRDKGGDFSLWTAHVVEDIPQFVSVFFADVASGAGTDQDRLRNLEVVKGFGQLSVEFRDKVPTGYCVDDVKRWAGTNTQYKPFGFAWGITHQTPYVCTDDRVPERGPDADNRWIGAERAACDGFFIACDNAPGAEQARCAAWNVFSLRFTQRGKDLRDAAINRYPARGVATYHTEIAWHWVALVAGAAATALAGLGVLIVRRRRTSAPASLGSSDAAA